MKKCIIVLGAPNDDKGQLSPIALSRLKLAFDLYTQERSWLLCTGGFGPGFNTSKFPHALYAQAHLQENGVLEKDLLAPALSANTVEDAILSLKQLKNSEIKYLSIVSSDYHIPRVKFIFTKLFKNFQLRYSAADSTHLEASIRNKLIAHETQALKKLQEKGLIIQGKVYR